MQALEARWPVSEGLVAGLGPLPFGPVREQIHVNWTSGSISLRDRIFLSKARFLA